MMDLNTIMVISLAILAFFSFCFFIVLIPVALQFLKTLNSMQQLLDTVNDDFEPAVKEIKESIYCVKNVFQSGRDNIKLKAGDTGILIASSAYGIMTGVKEYFSGYKTNKNGYNTKEGDKNV